MKRECKIAFATTLSGRWPRELPQNRLEGYSTWLKKSFSEKNCVIFPKIIDSVDTASEAVSCFKKEEADIVIMLYGAFTGDDIPCALAEGLGLPVILWAPYEPPFERETRLFANALVSATMNAAALHRIGCKCHVLYGSLEDNRMVSRLKCLISAYSVIKSMRSTLFGLLGYRPAAFYNCAFDEALIRRTFGIRMEETDLKVIFDRMEQISEKQVVEDEKQIAEKYDVSKLPEHHLENHSRLYYAIKQVIAEQGYDFATIKCWPEMGNLKATPCAVLGRLADDGVSVICEGDVDAGLATIVQRYLTGLPTFIADMINIDEEKNLLTYWHCGNPAPSLFDTRDGVTMNNHPLAGQGTAFYGALKPGDVTIARFCNIGNVYKLFLMRGKAVETKRNTRGAMAQVKVKTPVRELMEKIFDAGIAHHYSLVWKDVADEMEMVAQLLGIEVLEF